jgi:DNA primase
MAGIFDHAAISRVQQANDIVDVVAEHVSLKRKGREMLGLCPFHEDHTPSMNVSPTKQIFKCFACGAGGDVIKFVQMRENLTFPQAVERLAERAGIELESRRSAAPQRRDPDSDVDPNLLARVNAWAMKFFQQCLNDPERGKVARDYLARAGSPPKALPGGTLVWRRMPSMRWRRRRERKSRCVCFSRAVWLPAPARTSSFTV